MTNSEVLIGEGTRGSEASIDLKPTSRTSSPATCPFMAAAAGTENAKYCPKSDEGVRSAVKEGALVIGLGKAAAAVADVVRESLGQCAKPGDNWEVTWPAARAFRSSLLVTLYGP